MDHDFIDTVEATNTTLDHLEDFLKKKIFYVKIFVMHYVYHIL